MFKLRIIIPILLTTLFLFGCNKENGKKEYEMVLTFDSGDIFKDSGKIQEKKIKRRQGQEVHVSIFNGYTFLKIKDSKFICSYRLWLKSNTPVAFVNGATGNINGDVYFEGTYTQKGRAYTVENGTFEFIWRDDVTGVSVDNQVHKGKWTLKRK